MVVISLRTWCVGAWLGASVWMVISEPVITRCYRAIYTPAEGSTYLREQQWCKEDYTIHAMSNANSPQARAMSFNIRIAGAALYIGEQVHILHNTYIHTYIHILHSLVKFATTMSACLLASAGGRNFWNGGSRSSHPTAPTSYLGYMAQLFRGIRASL